jgi:hypothetical protein
VPRSTLYLRRRPDESFADAMADALETGTDLLENEALRRAKEGVARFYEGEVCGYVRKYSDTLLIFLLKARRRRSTKTGSSPNMPAATAARSLSRGSPRLATRTRTIARRDSHCR